MNDNLQNFNSKTTALPHQREATNYIYANNKIALFDEQGLGKTKVVIDALCWSIKEGSIECHYYIIGNKKYANIHF